MIQNTVVYLILTNTIMFFMFLYYNLYI